MWRRVKNKMLVGSLSLAAAGMLACMAALYDTLVPKGSVVAFLGTMLPLGVLVAGIVATFVWLCEHFEGHPERREGEPPKLRPPEFPTTLEERRHLLDEIERHRDVSPFPKQTLARDRYLDGIRGPALPRANGVQTSPLVGQWHGQ